MHLYSVVMVNQSEIVTDYIQSTSMTGCQYVTAKQWYVLPFTQMRAVFGSRARVKTEGGTGERH